MNGLSGTIEPYKPNMATTKHIVTSSSGCISITDPPILSIPLSFLSPGLLLCLQLASFLFASHPILSPLVLPYL